jgi:NAD(P)H-dependent nitrite reductase small subunit
MPEFIRVCRISEIPRRRGTLVIFEEDIQIAFFNILGEIHAVSNICPHQHSPVINEGYVDLDACSVTCPLHNWAFDLRTGQVLGGGTAALKTYQIRIEGEDVLIEKPEPEIPRWMGGGSVEV